jgi:hypothetical protein
MRTGGADGIDQADAAVGQSPCLVGNQYVDVAEILNADQSFDQNLEPRDPLLLLVPRVGNRIWSTKPAAALGFATVDAKDVRMADNRDETIGSGSRGAGAAPAPHLAAEIIGAVDGGCAEA